MDRQTRDQDSDRDEAVVEREFGALRAIPDQHPKWVVSTDTLWSGDTRGIRHRHIAEFLVNGLT